MNDNTLIFPFQDVDQSGVKDKTLFLILDYSRHSRKSG